MTWQLINLDFRANRYAGEATVGDISAIPLYFPNLQVLILDQHPDQSTMMRPLQSLTSLAAVSRHN